MAIQTLVNSLTPLSSTSRDDARPGDVITLNYVGGPVSSVSWSLVDLPEGPPPARTASAAALSSTTGLGPITFTVDNEGAYLIRQEVNDGSTVTTEFVRVRVLTAFGRLSLVAAGERRDDTGVIPVDASARGWAADQNANINTLAGYLSSVSSSGRLLYVDANRGRNYANTPNNPAVAEGFGDYATISEAITAAVSDADVNGGQVPDVDNPFVIAVRPGLYEEDLTLVPFVNVVGLPTTGGFLGDTDNSVRVRTVGAAMHTASAPLAADTVHVSNIMFENNTAAALPTFSKTGAGSCYLTNCRIRNNGDTAAQGPALSHQQGLLELDHTTVQQRSSDAGHLALSFNPSVGAASLVARNSRFEGPSVAHLDPSRFGSSEALFERCVLAQQGGGPTSVAVDTWASRAAFADCVVTKDDLTIPQAIRANPSGDIVAGDLHVELRGVRLGETAAALAVLANGINVGGTAIVYEGYSEFGGLALLNGATRVALTRAESIRYDNSGTGVAADNLQQALDYVVSAAGISFSGVSTLDDAYDGFDYSTVPATRLSGTGRTITADQGAVEIIGSSTSTLAPLLVPPVAGEGSLAVTQGVLVGAVGSAEITITPNKGHGPGIDMGSLVWPENAFKGLAVLSAGQNTAGGLFRNYDLHLQAASAQGSTALGSSSVMGDVLLGAGSAFASSGVNSPDGGSVFIRGGDVDASDAALAALPGDIYLAPGRSAAPLAPFSEGQVIVADMSAATPATLTALNNFTDAGVPTAGTLTFGTSRGQVQVTFAGGETWIGVGGVQDLLQTNTGFTASWTGGLAPIVLTTTDVGPKAEVFFVEDSTGGTLNTFFGNFAVTAGALLAPGAYPQTASFSAVGDRVLSLESVLDMVPIGEASIPLGQSGFFISDGSGGAAGADRPYYKDTAGSLFDLTAAGGVSLASESFIVLSASGALASERVLTGTAGQVVITDGGAGGNVTLSLAATGVVAGAYTNANLTVDAQGRIVTVTSGSASAGQVVADIVARDALTASAGDIAYVVDASADATVVAGAATYIWDGVSWLKIAEAEGEAEAASLRTLTGTAAGATDLGAFTGSTITGSTTIRNALQELEVAVEAAAGSSSGSVVATIAARNALTPVTGDVAHVLDASGDATVTSGAAFYIWDGASWLKIVEAELEAEQASLRASLGTAAGASDMGTFTGTTITDNVTLVAALQELEIALEAISPGSAGSVVADIPARDALTPAAGDGAYVVDASADATVGSGPAFYIYSGAVWFKVAEAETEAEADALRTLTGTAAGATDLGTFAGGVITDNVNLLTALQELETSVEAATGSTVVANIAARDALSPNSGDLAYVSDATADASVDVGAATYVWDGSSWQKVSEAETISETDALRALSGVAVGGSVLGSFTGSTIATGSTITAALQALETAVEGGTDDQVAAEVNITDAGGFYAGTEVEAALQEAGSDIADLRTMTGTADGATDMGTFTGTTITDNVTLRVALQELETALESGTDDQVAAEVNITDAGGFYTGTEVEAALQEAGQDIADFRSALGIADGASDLGTFTGSVITDNVNLLTALQELETAVESGTDDQVAAEVNITDAGGLYTGTEVEAALQEVGQDASELRSLTGTADGATVLGAFSGSTIATGVTITAALQALETAVEGGTDDQVAAEVNITDAGGFYTGTEVEAALQEVGQDASDLRALTGTADGSANLGAFSGSTITSNTTIRTALQELETAVEAASSSGSAGFIAANIAARDALTPTLGDMAYVTDASGDATVGSGSASYIYNGAVWLKIAEAETEAEADALRSLTGTASGALVLGAFSGTTIATGSTITAALQALETAVEGGTDDQTAAEVNITDAGGFYTGTEVEAALQEVGQDIADFRTALGIADGASDLGTFTGTTITDNVSLLAALQELETAVEAASSSGSAGFVVADIAARNALTPTLGDLAYVSDASGDATVGSGAATYVYNGATWLKVADAETETEAGALRTLTGTAVGASDMGTFTGGTITDNVTLRVALQELETAVEAGSDDQTAAEVNITDAGGFYTGTEVEAALQEAGQDIADFRTALGIADGASDLGTFTGAIITDNVNLRTALQELETAVEAGSDDQTAAEVTIADGGSFFAGANVELALQEAGSDIADIRTMTGTADGATDMGTFTGTTISDNVTLRVALQELETAVEAGTDDQVASEVNITDAGGYYIGTEVEAALQEVGQDASELRTLTGTADGATVLGAFSGTTIADGSTITSALQSLETAVEAETEYVLQSNLLVPVRLAAPNVVDDFHVCAWSSGFTPTRLRAYINEAIAPAGPGNVTVTAEVFSPAGVSLGVLGSVNADALVAGTVTTVALTAVAVPSDGVIRVRMEHPGGSPLLTAGDGLVFTITGTV